eukprot:gene15450-4267_t
MPAQALAQGKKRLDAALAAPLGNVAVSAEARHFVYMNLAGFKKSDAAGQGHTIFPFAKER